MKRFFKWLGGLLLVGIAALLIWGYAPDTDPAAMKAKYTNAASQFVDVAPGLSVHVRDEGKSDGPALLLLHGANSSLHTWEPWVTRLGSKYRIISLDLPGHGLTGANPKRGYEAATMVGTADAVMTKLGIERFAVAGNSMGGWVAWNYALVHPEKLDALILLNASGAPLKKQKPQPFAYRLAQSPVLKPVLGYFTPRSIVAGALDSSVSVKSLINDQAVDRYWELLRYPGNRQATADRQTAYRNRASTDMTVPLSKLAVPTLILWGDEDALVPVEAANWFERTIPGARKIIYPGIGHLPMEETPDRSAADIDTFLASLLK